jgi:tellurite resistance protein TehA-like permease
MERGWDPDVKKYLKKVMGSLCFGLLWLMAGVTAGIYYELAYSNGKPLIYTVLFYAGMLISLLLLIRYLYKTWKKEED